jgi:hypothetical protein
MKKRMVLTAMVSVALALGMALVGCDNGSTDSGGDGGNPLTVDSSWCDSTLDEGATHTYRFSATAGTTYNIKWDDSYEGSGSYTADIFVSASGAGITSFSYEDSAYSTPKTVTATSSGYITLTVVGFNFGTYAVKVDTGGLGDGGGPGDGGDPGLTFSGDLPGGEFFVYILPSSTNISSFVGIATALNNPVALGAYYLVSGNTVTLVSSSSAVAWTGSGSYKVVYQNLSAPTTYRTATVSFTNGSASVSLSSMGTVNAY